MRPEDSGLPIGGGWLHHDAMQFVNGHFDDEGDRFLCRDDAFWVEQGQYLRLTPWAETSLEIGQARRLILAEQRNQEGQKQYLELLVDRAIDKARTQ